MTEEEQIENAKDALRHFSKGALLHLAARDWVLRIQLKNELEAAQKKGVKGLRDGVQKALAKMAAEGGRAKHAADPRQGEKNAVYQEWRRWKRNEPGHEYVSKADFARIMINKSKYLKSPRVIENWCRNWEKETCND